MNYFHRTTALHGAVAALLLCAVALLLSFLLRPLLESAGILLFLAAAWASAWFYGRAGGMVCLAASAVAILFLVVPPETGIFGFSWVVVARLTAFILMGGLITWTTASLREGRRLFSATLSSIGDAVAAVDQEGCIVFLNPVA